MARKQLTNVDFGKNQILNVALQNLASAPSSPVAGQVYYDTGVNKSFYWNGTAWVDMTGGSVTYGAVSAQTSFGAGSSNGVASSVSRSDHLHGTPAHDAASHSGIKISDLASPTAAVAFNAQKITGRADPTAAQDAVTKAYADALKNGLDIKDSVRAATTAAGTLASSFENGDIVDGVTLVTGDRILIKDQSTGSQNGIYTVNASGAPTRATDMDTNAEATGGLFVFVEEGTVNGDSGWVMTNNGAVTIGTTALTFTQFSGAGQITVTSGLTKTGNVLGIDTAVVVRKFAITIGDGSATSFNIDHNLGTLDVTVAIYQVSDGAEVETDINHTTTNRVVINVAVAPTTNQYRVVVHG